MNEVESESVRYPIWLRRLSAEAFGALQLSFERYRAAGIALQNKKHLQDLIISVVVQRSLLVHVIETHVCHAIDVIENLLRRSKGTATARKGCAALAATAVHYRDAWRHVSGSIQVFQHSVAVW